MCAPENLTGPQFRRSSGLERGTGLCPFILSLSPFMSGNFAGQDGHSVGFVGRLTAKQHSVLARPDERV